MASDTAAHLAEGQLCRLRSTADKAQSHNNNIEN